MKADIALPVQNPVAPTGRSSWLRPKYLLATFIALMYVYVVWNNESFLINHADPEWAHIDSFKWWLLPHGLLAGCALLLGPLQFSDRLRKRFTKAHRVLGRFYVGGVLLGAPLGAHIQHIEQLKGTYSFSFTIATVVDAAIWIFATLMALAFILQGKVQLHRLWMTRSFACALIFLEVRVIGGVFNIDEKFTEIIVWGCVAAAYPLADLVLQIQELLRSKASAAKANRATAQTV